jgi:hypothetical protein
MDTNKTLRTTAASVIGARHVRAGRNGQDAAFAWCDGRIAVAVVCDGCSSGPSSEVGARLGSRWFAERLALALVAGAAVDDSATYEAARRDVAGRLHALADGDGNNVHAQPPADRIATLDADIVHEMLLFTILAVAVTQDGAAVWALGDGAYGYAGHTRVLVPFADNAPPYLAYDLLGDPRDAHFEVLPPDARRIVIATDGVADLHDDLGVFGAITTANPDALRRRLAQLATHDERIDWTERRAIRTPALLQDDCAVAIVEVLPGTGALA